MTDLSALMDTTSLALLMTIFITLGLAAWAGRAVCARRRDPDPSQDEGIKIVLGATLSLLGLMMGFLLSFAIGGYNTRISAEENEALAVGNAWQRIALLPSESARKQAEQMLRGYLATRIGFYQTPDDTERTQLRALSVRQQADMWMLMTSAAKADPSPVIMSLLDACNQLYVTQHKTMASWRAQIPGAAWLVLLVFGVSSSFLIGYLMRPPQNGVLRLLAVPFVTALVLFMMAEIDKPGRGVIHVVPQNLEALQLL